MNEPHPTPPQKTPQKQPDALPPLTTAQKVRFIIFSVFFVAVIGLWVGWSITNSNADNDLKDNGVRVTGTANGEYYEFQDKSLRSSTTKYKVKYDYTTEDGLESSAIGEKVYDTPTDVTALKGQKADVYYDPADAGKGTYVENEP